MELCKQKPSRVSVIQSVLKIKYIHPIYSLDDSSLDFFLQFWILIYKSRQQEHMAFQVSLHVFFTGTDFQLCISLELLFDP